MKIGVTGGIGSGKSFVVNRLEELGAKVYFADIRAKELVNLSDVKAKIIEEFGSKSYINKQYNTKYISKIVFNNAEKLNRLNSIIHPKVFEDFAKFCNQNTSKVIVYESALMIETGHTDLFDKVILVTAPIDVKITRVMKRDKIDKEAVLLRMTKQWDDNIKRTFSDFIIENIDKEKTITQVDQLWNSKFNIKD